MYRQGDVIVIPVKKGAVDKKMAEEVKPVGGKLILAEGEATGHHHAIPAGRHNHLYQTAAGMLMTLAYAAKLTHQEHGEIDLPAGEYKVLRQREWVQGKERNVQD